MLSAPSQPLFTEYARRIAEFATRYRLPTISDNPDFAADGGLMTYGTNRLDLCRQVASYVNRILKGAKPADLPVQQPTKFELVINAKTARAIGLAVPQSLAARADRIID
jgi:putative ABC transport system substrate-binding protein